MSLKKQQQKKKTKNKSTEYIGKLQLVKSGTGFVTVDGLERDIMIPPSLQGTALDGDTVKVNVYGSARGSGRQEGEVVEVISRRQTEFTGRIEVNTNYAFLIPDKDMPVDIFIPPTGLNGAKDGDHALVRLVEWTKKSKSPLGEVISILTDESMNEVAMQSILVEGGFPLKFPDDVLEEAARFPDQIDSRELANRRDMRDTLTITIDPVDAKDFDDAISIKRLRGGSYEIGVHIADVSYFVEEDSELDKEAYLRATSVYLPDRVLPMLPERLSNNLCSLRPDEDRYAFSAIFTITRGGKVKEYWLGRTIIRSRRRFTYEEVQEIIEGADGDHAEVLRTLNDLAQRFRAERFQKGAINFSSKEVRFQLDEHAVPIGVVVKESKEAHQLVEEFMLLANRTVAEFVSQTKVKDKPVPFPYRVHDVPDEDKLKLFTTFAYRFGYKFDLNSPEGIARSFNEMLRLAADRPELQVLESLGIRTMAKAVYTTENIGHYGLGFTNYCHFTSPIRRYPDILVHRVLDQILRKQVKPAKHMEQKCRHCSDQERRAMEAERAANKYKQVEFMQSYVGEEFDAVITGVAGFGFWAETVLHKCEGMVSLTELSEIDDFRHVDEEYALVGIHTGVRFSMGDKLKVQVISANLGKRQIEFGIAELPAQSNLKSGAKKKKAKAGEKSGKKAYRNTENKKKRKTGRKS